MLRKNIIPLAVLLLHSPTNAAVYDRPLDMVYALDDGLGLPQYNDTELLNHFDMVTPAITSMVPFLLNVAQPDKYSSILSQLAKRNITIVPAVGGAPADGDIDLPKYKAIAKGYKPYSDYIRLENMQDFYDMYNATGIQNMIDHCVSLGFEHIMLNPWPQVSGGVPVSFSNEELDATIYQVLLSSGQNSSTDWYPGNQDKIDGIRKVKPNIEILINYESPPQQDVLTSLGKTGSENAMEITITEIQNMYKAENLHWIPPLDQSYDAIALGTWSWIAEKLSSM
ncbi:hypothetical protein F5Y16DRAFT_163586 [Xylariaceae sp. FL0255]|nr:hypothetical protein F5Y16DRAFT_163586 [Xylariaceae sp. FL0255]